jgi:hypothetical protein
MNVPPILVLVFNRPEITRRLIEALRQAAPPVLYVAADGPRDPARHPQDGPRCAETRAVLESIDWPCRVKTLFREQNLGCARGVAEAITWFFQHESEGLILEDDCIPHPDFFRWGAELLARYRNDDRVFCINGSNLQSPAGCFGAADYAYTNFPLVWGWGSWARAWQKYRLRPTPFPVLDLQKPGISWHQAQAHSNRIQEALARMDTWDCQWSLTVLQNNGLCPTPRVNLVSNIGFGPDATHTLAPNSPLANLATATLPETLVAANDPARSLRCLNQHIATLNVGRAGRLWRRYWSRKLLKPFSLARTGR